MPLLCVSKTRVIASQLASWRGNLLDFQFQNRKFFPLFRGSPHQSADWFTMTSQIKDFFDSLKGGAMPLLSL